MHCCNAEHMSPLRIDYIAQCLTVITTTQASVCSIPYEL
uniref:Uncharacterized protein n=1 Tax=Arundo donax TaxID=35708 RepID=A0A0A9CCS1_ARUDO